MFFEAHPIVDTTEADGDEEESGTAPDATAELDNVEELCKALQSAKEEQETLRQAAESTKRRLSEVWAISCGQLTDFESTLTSKEEEIATLRRKVADLERQLREARAGTVTVLPSVPTATWAPPTATGAPPTATWAPPTATRAPPTATGAPPTATWAPPTATGAPPTATWAPPTATWAPPTATEAPPTATGAPPTATGAPPTATRTPPTTTRALPVTRSGKAPPVDMYSGDSYELLLDDWLPTLNRAAEWNAWSEDEKLLQLAGHLRGRAYQEWSLIDDTKKLSYDSAVEALHIRLDQGGKVLAAQDFRHLIQKDRETVAEFVRRLERTFRVRDSMSPEMRDTLLCSQLQESLRQEIMNGPAVSGAQSYPELCVAAKNEEQRIAGLRKRESYQKTRSGSHPSTMETRRTNPQ